MLELGGEESSRRAEAGTGLAGWHYLPRWTTGLRGIRTRRGAGGGGVRAAPPFSRQPGKCKASAQAAQRPGEERSASLAV